MDESFPIPPEVVQRFNRFGDQVQEEITKSVVRITWVAAQRYPDDRQSFDSWKPTARFRSGFLVYFCGRTLFGTAGHVVQDLVRDAAGNSKVVLIQLNWSPRGDELVTVRVPAQQLGNRYDVSTGLDVGVIEIPREAALELSANGAEWIDAEAYRPPEFEPHLFVTAGFPQGNRHELPSFQGETMNIAVYQECPMIPLSPIRDEFAGSGRLQMFRGRILSRYGLVDGAPCVIADTNGMSGAPIYAIRLDEYQWTKGLVAIQTHEREDSSEISGNFFRHFLEFLRERVP